MAHRPSVFHVMTKPRGAVCNLDCKYCYFLSKEKLYPDSAFRMSETLLEAYTRQYIQAQQVPEITFAWQGGEPTLMGVDFYRLAISYQQKYKKPGMRIYNTLQTNAINLDEEWCAFLKEHQVLVGVSLDGPQPLHDAYRVDKGGAPTFERVMQGIRQLQRHQVDFNVLTTLHAANADHPLTVYRFLRDEVGTAFMQFIPIVERDNITGYQEGTTVTGRSVTAEQYGRFPDQHFDEWVRRDVGRVFVQIFDVALAAWSGESTWVVYFEPTCGNALALEHNGDVFSCDHYVEPNYHLGNITTIPLSDIAVSDKQQAFGLAKRYSLPQYCRVCDVRFVCNGGCPKDRLLQTPDGEPGLNYLCAAYQQFFRHIDAPMRFMANELNHRRAPANIMPWLAHQDELWRQAMARTGRNDLCPCGSGLKFKRCHGRSSVIKSASPDA